MSENLRRFLINTPDGVPKEDLKYHIAVIAKIERGLRDAVAGRVFSQNEIEESMERWSVK